MDKKVAILATNGFEKSELFRPKDALEAQGVEVHVISLEDGQIRSWDASDWGPSISVDLTLENAKADEYDGLVLPGGVINPDILRTNEKAVEFVRSFFGEKYQKPVAAICHGPWMLVEAGVLEGRKVTSYASIKTDVKNAGGLWSDEEVVVDKGLITSRSPEDLDAFIDKIIEELKEGEHRMRKASSEKHAN